MKVRLSVQHKKANVKSVVLHTDALIGRSTECNLRLASGQVSRRHCKLLISDEQVAVIDLGSSNGTFLNDEKITPKVEIPIPPGSELCIGPARFVVQYDDPAAETHIRKGAASASDADADEPQPGRKVPPDEMPTADALPVHENVASESPGTTDDDSDLEISDEELEALLAEEGFESEGSHGIDFAFEDDSKSKAGPESETVPFTLPDDAPAQEEFPEKSAETPASNADAAPDTDEDKAADDDEEDVMKFLQDLE